MRQTRVKSTTAPIEQEESRKKRRPRTREEWEDRCIALSYKLVEKRLIEGTATSQETTHFLKLGSTKELLEREMMETQNELMAAKRDQIHSQGEMREMLTEALKAFTEYSGGSSE